MEKFSQRLHLRYHDKVYLEVNYLTLELYYYICHLTVIIVHIVQHVLTYFSNTIKVSEHFTIEVASRLKKKKI